MPRAQSQRRAWAYIMGGVANAQEYWTRPPLGKASELSLPGLFQSRKTRRKPSVHGQN